MATSDILQARIQKAKALLPPPHLLPPQVRETFLSLEGAKIRTHLVKDLRW